VPRSRVITSYTSSPQAPSWRVVGLVMWGGKFSDLNFSGKCSSLPG
jgi:hypothetical protein